MIEIPRACVVADEIAKEAEFFSFGTNDLTQTTLGMSRDDSGSFLPAYQGLEIIKQNPFATVDTDRRRRPDEDGHRAAAARRAPTSSWASAANTAAIPPPSSSATTSG